MFILSGATTDLVCVTCIQARGLYLTSKKTARCAEVMWTPGTTRFRDRCAVHFMQTAISYARKHGNSPTMLVWHAGYEGDGRQGLLNTTPNVPPNREVFFV